MPIAYKILGVAMAGGVGAIVRYGVGGYVTSTFKGPFPWGTVVVNLVGCLLFGFIVALLPEGSRWHGVRPYLLTGFMGSFTTFSTFMHETQVLLDQEQYLPALGNIAMQNGIGLVALLVGLMIGRALV